MLNEINTIKAYAIRFENYMYTFKMWKLRQKTVVVCLDTKRSTHFFGMNKPDGTKGKETNNALIVFSDLGAGEKR